MLTPAQLVALKADILADATLSAIPNSADGAFAVAAIYNTVAVPNFFVWSTAISISEIMGNGFDWSRVDNLTVGRARIWEYMTSLEVINPSQGNIRSGILAAFNQAADSGMRLAIFGHCQKLATRIEKLFATGTGTTTTDQAVGPGSMGFVGPVTPNEITDSRNLP